MNFTIEQIRMLAENEQRMDEGSQPFVILNGRRCAFKQDVMDFLELEQGQTISEEIFMAGLRANIDFLNVAIAEQKMNDEAGNDKA